MEAHAFLASAEVVVTPEEVDPATLRNHQRIDVIHAKAMPDEVRRKPILVSADGFILDGNHRWKLHLSLREPVNAYRIGLPFEEAIAVLFRFPGTYDLADRPDAH